MFQQHRKLLPVPPLAAILRGVFGFDVTDVAPEVNALMSDFTASLF